MNKREQLVHLLSGNQPIMIPGAYSAMTAKLVEQAGFPAVYMTGYGTTANLIAKPDLGLLTMTEMVGNARSMAQAVNIPLIADADTGYGNVNNVRRTVEEYEQAGIAAIHLEDQVIPKKCGHMNGKQVITMEENAQKIRAAASARTDRRFQIIARTDARAVTGFDDALRRGHAYAQAGADILFIEAPQSIEEMEKIGQEFKGIPLVANMVEHGKTPFLTAKELGDLGFQVIIYPVTMLFSAVFAMQEALRKLAEHGTSQPLLPAMVTFNQFTDFIGLPEAQRWEEQFKAETV